MVKDHSCASLLLTNIHSKPVFWIKKPTCNWNLYTVHYSLNCKALTVHYSLNCKALTVHYSLNCKALTVHYSLNCKAST